MYRPTLILALSLPFLMSAVGCDTSRANKTNVAAFKEQGDAWLEKRHYDNAIALYTEAIRLDPTNAVIYNSRGIAWYNKRSYEMAMKDFICTF